MYVTEFLKEFQIWELWSIHIVLNVLSLHWGFVAGFRILYCVVYFKLENDFFNIEIFICCGLIILYDIIFCKLNASL